MRRLVLLLLAILIPLQSAAAVVSVDWMAGVGCDMSTPTEGAVQGLSGDVFAATSDCCGIADQPAAAVHQGVGHHACPHVGTATLAIACTAWPAIVSATGLPEAPLALFDSIVLGVPSPPPTLRV